MNEYTKSLQANKEVYEALNKLRKIKEETASLRDVFDGCEFDTWLHYCDMEVNIRRLIDELEKELEI